MAHMVFAREVAPGGMAALPSVNTRVTVSPASRAAETAPGRAVEAPTLVEDLRVEVGGRRSDSAELVVAQPAFAGNLHGEIPGTKYLVRWVTERGVHEVTGRFVSRERIGPTLLGWRLHVTGPVSRIQRRAHARVDVVVPIEVLVLHDGREGTEAGVVVVRGATVNLSEGGVLAALEPPVPELGDTVTVRLALAGEAFTLSGRVVRREPIPGSRGTRAEGRLVAIAFDTPDAHGDRLRPLLFEHQLRGRRTRQS